MTLKSVLVILVNFWTVCYVSTNHCDVVDTLNNQWVNVDSLKTDHDPRYLSESPASSQEDCQKACCQTDKCSVVIFDTTQNQSNTNCFLLDCSQVQECVFEHKDGTVTFAIDKKHEASAETKTITKSVTVASPTLASITKQPTTTTTTAPKIITTTAKPNTTTVPKTTTAAPKTTKTTTESPTAAPVISPSTTSNSPSTSKETPKAPQPSATTTTMTTTTTTRTTTVPTIKSVATNATYNQLLKTTAAPTTVSVLTTKSPTTVTSTNQTTQSNTTSDSVSNTTTTKSGDVTVQSSDVTSNATTAESVINKETTQLLNTTLSSLVNSTVVQIKPPPISTQPFISVPLSISSSSSSSPSSSSSSSPSSSTKSSITTQSPLLSTKDPSNNTSTSATGEIIITTLQTEVFNPNATNTSTDSNATQIASYGRLDNTDQQEPSNAMFGGLIALFCFGTIFVLAIVVIFSKKLFEVWQRRHYSRIDYLVNGMYN